MNFDSQGYDSHVERKSSTDASFWLLIASQDIAWIEHCQVLSVVARANENDNA